MDTAQTQQNVSTPRGPLHAALRDTGKVSWTEFAGARALRCLPAIIAPLAYGMVYDKPVQSLLAAACALSVGFGSFKQLYHSRLAPMVLASVSVAVSALVGTQIGHWSLWLVVAAALWGFLCGISSAVGPGATYIGTQSIVFLLVASSFPLPARDAVPLVTLMLGAGLLQTLIISLCRLALRRPVTGKTLPQTMTRPGLLLGTRLALHTLRQTASRRKIAYYHGVRLALTMVVSTGLSRLSHSPHNYWMPMTTALILQQDLHQTVTRALSRIGGTLIGVGLATLIAAALRPEHAVLVALIVLFAWLAYSTLQMNYFIFAIFITAYIVFLLSFAGLPELSVIALRTKFTVLGAAIALLPYVVLHARHLRRRNVVPTTKAVG